jgi:hypothetical protein
MFNLWIIGLITSMQYLVPLISAIILVRAKTTRDRQEEITRLVTYFMVQSVLNEIEYYSGLGK